MPRHIRNILFVMFDQLRFDYLSCYGHPYLQTPHIDALAARGVRFTRAYVQSPICGPSRMSFYTGRYVHSHGSAWNGYPLKVGEMTLGDHLRSIGMGCWLVGKTHMYADAEGMARLGLSPDTVIGARVAECGFDIFERDDGMRPEGPDGLYEVPGAEVYNEYLRSRGYDSENPWHDFANAARDGDGELASGWFLRNVDRPAAIAEEDSETPYMTGRGIAFMDRAGSAPWLCHLSYIKPHWPYIAPAPYHAMYSHNQVLPVVRHPREKESPHPVYREFMERRIGQTFSRDEVRDKVVPVYMGLIKQCDDQMGRLFAWMEKTGRMDDTMIVVTSDHGDYLGDHWLGEKELFHEPSVKIPLIVYDPSEGADAARGTVCDELVESLDLAATFIEAAGGKVPDHIVEGRSLLPFLRGEAPARWRDFVISEYDYASTATAAKLGVEPRDAVMFMVADRRWKLIHVEGFRPLLFDLESDPDEFVDLGESAEHEAVREAMYDHLFRWARRRSQRTTRSEDQIKEMRGDALRRGVLIGVWDAADLSPELTAKYRSRR